MSQLTSRVPVGFRFHPTDEELVGYYLPKKVNARKIDLDLIRELDLYKLEPWDLQELCKIQASSVAVSSVESSSEKPSDCYFFSRKDKKYPTGNRANRATAKGFWKATGRDKPISAKLHTRLIGMRKTLVFYQGRAPHGVKTEWIMHEFRLDDGPGRPAHEDGGWVVCRVFQKNKNLKLKLHDRVVSYEGQQVLGLLPDPKLGSPGDILSTGRYTFSEHHQLYHQFNNPSIKQEIINLDDYQSHHQSYGSFPTFPHSNSMLPSTTTFARASSFRRPSPEEEEEDGYFNIPESFQQGGDFQNEATTSGSDGEEAILGVENVDWSALLQEPPKTPSSGVNSMEYTRGSSGKIMSDTDFQGQQIKRQNSDIFSSMELWNYNPVAQQL